MMLFRTRVLADGRGRLPEGKSERVSWDDTSDVENESLLSWYIAVRCSMPLSGLKPHGVNLSSVSIRPGIANH